LLGFLLGSNSKVIAANFTNFWNGEWIHFSDENIEWTEQLSGFSIIAAIGVAIVGSLFSSDAWNNITFTAGEVKEPKKNIPRSLFLGTLTVTIIYLLANVAYLSVLPLMGTPGAADPYSAGIQFASEDRIGTAAAYTIFGAPAEIIMAVLIMISTFGCNNGLILAGARVYYSMANDKLFFKSAGLLNNNSVPSKALIFQAVWAGILCLSGTYGQLLDYVIFTVLIFTCYNYCDNHFKKKKHAERSYKFGIPHTNSSFCFCN
jgi:APA family basic amino acid/polyamine antiporter